VKIRLSIGARTYLLIAIASATVCSIMVFWASLSANRSSEQPSAFFQPLAAAPIWPLPSALNTPETGTRRAVFPYSVIAGGADSAQELRNAVMRDSVVAQHYSDFDLANVRRVTLTAPQLMYVSYRIGNKIFWTKRRLTLAKGETVLTDGHAMARTRCGNRVSALPIRPNALAEPTPEEFNAPELPHAASTPYLAAYSPVPSSNSVGGGEAPITVSSLTPLAPFFPFPGGGGVTVGGGHTSTTPPGGGGTTPPGGGGTTPPGGGDTTPPGGGGTTPPGGGGTTPPGGGGTTPPGGGGTTPPGGGGTTPPVGVPEPGTAAMVLVGLGAAAWMARRRSKLC
jgi:hypothetical protein